MNLKYQLRFLKTFKRSNLLIILLLFLALGGASASATDGPEWQFQIVDGSEVPPYDVGQYSSIALDPQGIPHISYYDDVNGDLKYASQIAQGVDTADDWKVETVDSSGDVGRYTSLAIDAYGIAHISYYDSSYGDLKYTRQLTETGWFSETVDLSGDVGKYSSLALDAGGNPHISYYDFDLKDLKYAFFDGSGWVLPENPVDGSGDVDVGTHTSLALDSSGFPHISYIDNTLKALKYAHKTTPPSDPDDWVFGWVEMEANQYTRNTSLALDRQDTPHIATIKQIGLDPSKFQLEYYTILDDRWYTETVTTWAVNMGEVSLALDRSDRPHIAFYDGEQQVLKYAFRGSDGWHIEPVDVEVVIGTYPSIALSGLGLPHISYRYNKGEVYNLKYATLPLILRHAFIPLTFREWVDYFTWYHEDEDNDSIAQANGALVFGQQYIGYHNDEDDYYSIFTSSSTTLRIDLDTDHLELDDSGYNVVQLILYSGAVSPERVGWVYSPPYNIEFDASAGWYYVRVYTAPGYLDGSKEYRLTVTTP
jgi:hypothetical protein